MKIGDPEKYRCRQLPNQGVAKNGELLGPKVKDQMGYSKAHVFLRIPDFHFQDPDRRKQNTYYESFYYELSPTLVFFVHITLRSENTNGDTGGWQEPTLIPYHQGPGGSPTPAALSRNPIYLLFG